MLNFETRVFESKGNSTIQTLIQTNNGKQSASASATGTLTSTQTGNNIYEAEQNGINVTISQSTDLGINLIDNLINNNEEINDNYLITTSNVIINALNFTKKQNFNPIDNIVNGITYNVNNSIKIISKFIPDFNAAGANVTVDYYATIFPEISYFSGSFLPLINFGPNDYLLYEITVPDNVWLYNHNLFSFTPYFYNYTNNNVTTSVFASTDITIQFFEKFKNPNNKINICVTSSIEVGNYFENKGYIISKLPIEYINVSTFLPLFRVGLFNNENSYNINSFVKSYYFKSSSTSTNNNYSSIDIIASFPQSLLPSDKIFYSNLLNYQNIVS